MEINLKLPLGRLFPTLLVLALTAGCSSHSAPASKAGGKPPGVKVKLATVQPGTIDTTEEYIANIESRRSVELKPQIEGQVTQIFVKEGDLVPEGKEIIRVDPAKQQASVSSFIAAAQAAQADLQNAKATLSSLEAQRLSKLSDLKFNQQQYQRYATLYAQGAVTQLQRDQYANSLDVARSSLNALDQQIQAQRAAVAKAEKAVQQAQANTKQQQVQLQYFKITAPFTGTIGNIPARVGDFVNTSSALTTITDNKQLEVRFSVQNEMAPNLRVGMPVEVWDEQGRRVGTSQVFFISPRGSTDTDSISVTGTVVVKSLFDNSKGQLRTAERARARVIWDQRPGVLIPRVAVSRLAGKEFVFVAQPQAQSPPAEQAKSPQGQSPPAQPGLVARQKPVKLGANRGNNVQVLEGLQPGEKIVTAGILNLQDGAPIIPES